MDMNESLFFWINSHAGHNVFIDGVMIGASTVLPYVCMLALALYFGLGVLRANRFLRQDSVAYGVYIVLTMIVASILAHCIPESRPFVTHSVNMLLPHVADNSFPSDHATGSMAVALSLYALHKKTGPVWILVALLIGISRVYVGHHYPLDVIGGFAIAIICFALYKALLKQYVVKFYDVIDRHIFTRCLT